MNEREEQIRQRIEAYKEELGKKRVLPVHLDAEETQHLIEDVEYLLEVVGNLRKGNVTNGETAP